MCLFSTSKYKTNEKIKDSGSIPPNSPTKMNHILVVQGESFLPPLINIISRGCVKDNAVGGCCKHQMMSSTEKAKTLLVAKS